MKKSILEVAVILAALTACSTDCPAPNASMFAASAAPPVAPVAASIPKGAQATLANGLCLFATSEVKGHVFYSSVEVHAAVANPVNGKCTDTANLRPVQKIAL